VSRSNERDTDTRQTDDFADGTWFLAVKLGAPRPFEFTDAETGDVVYSAVLEAGTGVWVRAKGAQAANVRTKHSVPVVDGPCGVSGSLVFRCIDTVLKYDELRKKVSA